MKLHPPIDSIVVLGTYVAAQSPYESVITWVSQNGELCYGSADMSTRSANRSILSLSCGTAPAELTTRGADGAVTRVAGLPADPEQGR